jgi:hypothetical protein
MKTGGDDPQIAKVTESIERSGKTQLRLIEDLLDMTRVVVLQKQAPFINDGRLSRCGSRNP